MMYSVCKDVVGQPEVVVCSAAPAVNAVGAIAEILKPIEIQRGSSLI
jgi:hypothetical protein